MDCIVECIPNFSEGRDQAVVQALANAILSVPRVFLLDRTMDRDHHRSVLTFAGEPEAVAEAAFRALSVATERIDVRRHQGVHPRIGATDVVPFVPIKGVTMRDCVRLARQLGKRVGRELALPVFLYEQAARHRHRAPLETIRCGGLGGLAARMASHHAWRPDYGPRRLHRTAGAVAIGARPPLIAFNVNLRSRNLDLARSIAKTIRQSNGGVPHLKAIGVELASRRMVQVAMNLTDYRVTPPHVAFEVVQAQAALRGVRVAASEVVGLIPQEALVAAAADSLRLEGFDRTKVLESRIEEALESAGKQPRSLPVDLLQRSLSELLAAVAAPTPMPAGAAVASWVGAFAAALGIMVARLSGQGDRELRLAKLSGQLTDLARADGVAYQRFHDAAALPVSARNRSAAVSATLHRATEVPVTIAERSLEVVTLLNLAMDQARPRVRSDLRVGMLLARAATKAALHTARENIKIQINQRLKHLIHRRIEQIAFRLEEEQGLCYTSAPSQAVAHVDPFQALPGKARKQNEWKSRSLTTTSKKRSKLPRKSSRVKGSSGS